MGSEMCIRDRHKLCTVALNSGHDNKGNDDSKNNGTCNGDEPNRERFVVFHSCTTQSAISLVVAPWEIITI